MNFFFAGERIYFRIFPANLFWDVAEIEHEDAYKLRGKKTY